MSKSRGVSKTGEAGEERICLKLNSYQGRYHSDDFAIALKRELHPEPTSLREIYLETKCILMSEKGRLTVSQFHRQYQWLCYSSIPHRNFGFQSLSHLLRTFTDILRLEGDLEDPDIIVLDSVKESRVFKLVAAQKSPKLPQKVHPKVKKFSVQLPVLPFPAHDVVREILWENPRGLSESKFEELLNVRLPLKMWELDIAPSKLVDCVPHLFRVVDGKVLSLYPLEITDVCQLLTVSNIQYTVPTIKNSKLEREVGKNLEILVNEKKEVVIEDVSHIYRKRFGKDLLHQQFGFRQLWKFLAVVYGNFSMRRSGDSYVLQPHSHIDDPEPDKRSLHFEDHCGLQGWGTMIHEIKKVVACRSEGVNIEHFAVLYEEEWLKKIIFRVTEEDFFKDLQDKKVLSLETRGHALFAVPLEVIVADPVVYKPKPLPLPDNLIASICDTYPEQPDLPMNTAVQFGFLSYERPDVFHVQSYFGDSEDTIIVSAAEIGEMLTKFYITQYNEYKVRDFQTLCEGMPLAVCSSGKWHRVVVLQVFLDLNEAKVRAVDNGWTRKCNIVNTCYLGRQFLKWPPCALKATSTEKVNWSDFIDDYLDCDLRNIGPPDYFDANVVGIKDVSIK